jgi:hypothetical protein
VRLGGAAMQEAPGGRAARPGRWCEAWSASGGAWGTPDQDEQPEQTEKGEAGPSEEGQHHEQRGEADRASGVDRLVLEEAVFVPGGAGMIVPGVVVSVAVAMSVVRGGVVSMGGEETDALQLDVQHRRDPNHGQEQGGEKAQGLHRLTGSEEGEGKASGDN